MLIPHPLAGRAPNLAEPCQEGGVTPPPRGQEHEEQADEKGRVFWAEGTACRKAQGSGKHGIRTGEVGAA